MINKQPKTFENLNIDNIKFVIMGHPKTLHELPKTIRYFENLLQVSFNSPLYTDTKK